MYYLCSRNKSMVNLQLISVLFLHMPYSRLSHDTAHFTSSVLERYERHMTYIKEIIQAYPSLPDSEVTASSVLPRVGLGATPEAEERTDRRKKVW